MIYRVITHETKQCQLWELDTYISLEQLHRMLELCDVYDAIHKIGRDKAEAQAKQNNKR